MKSAVLARASGAARVVGFSIGTCARRRRGRSTRTTRRRSGRRRPARHRRRTCTCCDASASHDDARSRFRSPTSPSARAATASARDRRPGPFALINPGAAWPNKRWPPERFGEVAAFLREVRGLPSVVLWGPARRRSRARSSPPRAAPRASRRRPSVADLVALVARGRARWCRATPGRCTSPPPSARRSWRSSARPIPQRNGPWAADDVAVSRYDGVRLSLRAPVPSRPTWCLARHRGRGGHARRSSSACGGRAACAEMLRVARALARARSGFVFGAVALWLARADVADRCAIGAAVALLGEALRSGPPATSRRAARSRPPVRTASRGTRCISARRSSASASRSRRTAWSWPSLVAGVSRRSR